MNEKLQELVDTCFKKSPVSDRLLTASFTAGGSRILVTLDGDTFYFYPEDRQSASALTKALGLPATMKGKVRRFGKGQVCLTLPADSPEAEELLARAFSPDAHCGKASGVRQ